MIKKENPIFLLLKFLDNKKENPIFLLIKILENKNDYLKILLYLYSSLITNMGSNCSALLEDVYSKEHKGIEIRFTVGTLTFLIKHLQNRLFPRLSAILLRKDVIETLSSKDWDHSDIGKFTKCSVLTALNILIANGELLSFIPKNEEEKYDQWRKIIEVVTK
jgi:hypothetical protein